MPNSTSGSSRPDGVDVFEYARKQGYNVFTDRAGFDALKGGKAKAATKPYVGLFTRSHMSYEVRMSVARDMTEMLTQCQIDRDPAKEPSLVEMAKTAINSLKEATKHSDKGYFIVRSLFSDYSVVPILNRANLV